MGCLDYRPLARVSRAAGYISMAARTLVPQQTDKTQILLRPQARLQQLRVAQMGTF